MPTDKVLTWQTGLHQMYQLVNWRDLFEQLHLVYAEAKQYFSYTFSYL